MHAARKAQIEKWNPAAPSEPGDYRMKRGQRISRVTVFPRPDGAGLAIHRPGSRDIMRRDIVPLEAVNALWLQVTA